MENLTGRFIHKNNFWGNLILHVEVKETNNSLHAIRSYYIFWRKAKSFDLPFLNLKSDLIQNTNDKKDL